MLFTPSRALILLIILQSVAALLGVSSASLYRGLTTRTHNVRGQLVKSMCDANMVCKYYSCHLHMNIPVLIGNALLYALYVPSM